MASPLQVRQRQSPSGRDVVVILAGRGFTTSPFSPISPGRGLFPAGRSSSIGSGVQEVPTVISTSLAMRGQRLVLVRSAVAGQLVICPDYVTSTSTCTTPTWEDCPVLRERLDMALSVWGGLRIKGLVRGCPLRSIYRGTKKYRIRQTVGTALLWHRRTNPHPLTLSCS